MIAAGMAMRVPGVVLSQTKEDKHAQKDCLPMACYMSRTYSTVCVYYWYNGEKKQYETRD